MEVLYGFILFGAITLTILITHVRSKSGSAETGTEMKTETETGNAGIGGDGVTEASLASDHASAADLDFIMSTSSVDID